MKPSEIRRKFPVVSWYISWWKSKAYCTVIPNIWFSIGVACRIPWGVFAKVQPSKSWQVEFPMSTPWIPGKLYIPQSSSCVVFLPLCFLTLISAPLGSFSPLEIFLPLWFPGSCQSKKDLHTNTLVQKNQWFYFICFEIRLLMTFELPTYFFVLLIFCGVNQATHDFWVAHVFFLVTHDS